MNYLTALIERCESLAPRAVWMVIPCVVSLNLWRALPYQSPWAPAAYAAGGLIILLVMRAFRYRILDAAFTVVAALVLLSIFSAMQGEPSLARIWSGGVLVVLVAAAAAGDEPMDRALAIGQALTLLAWFAGNVARGTFGYEVASSALGQAYGAFAEPLLWFAIMAAYTVTWYNQEANKTR